MELLIIPCSFVVGILIGLTGMGGGSVMTGLLILGFGVPPLTAVGTDLLFAAATKSAGAAIHHRNGNVAWRVVLLLGAGSLPGSAAALWWLALYRDDLAQVSGAIRTTIGVALMLAALGILFRRQLRRAALGLARRRGAPASEAWTVMLGIVLGSMVTLSSVGAGAIGIAVLVALYPAMSAARLVGSDIAHAVPLTIVAGLGHALIGSVDYGLLLTMLIGSIPGIYVGSRITALVREPLLFIVLAGVLLTIGLRLALI